MWYLGRYLHIDTETIRQSLSKFPVFISGALYIILYVIVTFFIMLSKDMFWLVGAVLFGPYLSALFVFIAETVNAFILFYLARLLGRGFVEHSAKGKDKYKYLDEKIGRLSFGWLFFFRVTPLIPYRFVDLAAGLTRISFRKYLAAVILGSPLKIFWVQYIVAGVGEAMLNNPYAIAEFFLKNQALFFFSLIYPVLVILVVFKLKSKG
jgi:uncharacterized membrane protein YdjX (TVP38/TMEM64 family)